MDCALPSWGSGLTPSSLKYVRLQYSEEKKLLHRFDLIFFWCQAAQLNTQFLQRRLRLWQKSGIFLLLFHTSRHNILHVWSTVAYVM